MEVCVFFLMYINELNSVCPLISFEVLGESAVFYIHAVCVCKYALEVHMNKSAMNTSY